MRLPLNVRQVVTDRSGDAAQLVERRDNTGNRKVAKAWFDSRCGSASRTLKKDA